MKCCLQLEDFVAPRKTVHCFGGAEGVVKRRRGKRAKRTICHESITQP